jgi:predicted metalloprotease with PDZ domain
MRTLKPWLVAASIFWLAGMLAAEAADYWCPATGVGYGVTLHPAEHIVHVDAVTHEPAPEFQLPVWNALYQVRDFAVNVRNVKAYDGVPEWMCDGCATRDAATWQRDKTSWQISTSGKHPCVTFSYDVSTNDPGSFGSSLDAQHGFFNWAEVLVYRPDERYAPVSLRLFGVPQSWTLRDGGLFSKQGGEVPGTPATAQNYDRLVDSPAMLGKLYETKFQQDGATYSVVVDSPEVDLSALQLMLRKITAAAVEWMQDRPYDNYTFMFLAAYGSGAGGMEHANSAVIDIGEDALKRNVSASADYASHELFHLWNVKRIRPQSLEPIDYAHEQYSRVLWFSEGVTSTAAQILKVRAGLSDEQHLLTHLGSVITALQSRSARLTQSLEEASVDTWLEVHPAYRRAERSISYYGKGELLGFLIDLEMRRLTNGRSCLRDLFQYMNEHYGKTGVYFDDSEGVRRALQELTGNDFRDFFRRYVSGVEEIPYDQFFNYVGLSVHHRQVSLVDAGFVASSSPGESPKIVGVDEDSAAAHLGLLSGDAILSVNGKAVVGDWNQFLQKQNPRSHLRLKLRSARGETLVVNLPLSTRKIDQYRFSDVPEITAELKMRRASFVRGEAYPSTPTANLPAAPGTEAATQ